MVIQWLMTAAGIVWEMILAAFSWLPELPEIPALTVTVPVPVLAASAIAALNDWVPVAMGVFGALIVGRLLQWIYEKIPFKAS